MTTYYIDPLNGSDANIGTSWGAAWKTSATGATLARIAPGDIINVAKSPDPTSVGNATWNNLSKTITLAAAKTAKVNDCETVWTTSDANVTLSTEATIRKEGSYSLKIVIAAGFATGKVAYQAITQTDFSDYEQLSFWLRSSLTVAANIYKFCLCSDTAGETIVDEFVLPAIETAQVSYFKPFTVNKGSALGASIKSIALYAIADPGAPTLYMDNFIAVKDATSDDSLSLTSLISKNSLATGGAEAWYPIKSIDGVTVIIDNQPSGNPTIGNGYFGASEVVETYKRESFAINSGDWAIMDSGTAGSFISFAGGYNTSTDVQEGETFFDVGGGIGSGLSLSSKNYVSLDRLNMVRANNGLYLTASTGCAISFHTLCGNNDSGVSLNSGSYFNSITGAAVVNNATYGIYAVGSSTGSFSNEFNIGLVNNNLSNGVLFTSYASFNRGQFTSISNNIGYGLCFTTSFENHIKATDIKDNTTYGVSFLSNSSRNIVEAETTDNTTGAVYSDTLCRNFLKHSALNESTVIGGLVNCGDGQVSSTFQDGSADNNYIYTDGGIIKSQTVTRHTASGVAWQLMPTSTTLRKESRPLSLSLAKVAVYASTEVTVKAFFQKDNAAITGRLICKKWQLAGIDADAIATKNSTTGAWEELTITFTPTETGVVEICAEAWGGTAYSVFVDDITILQA